MKRTTLFILTLGIVGFANAQSFTEGFEGITPASQPIAPLPGWTVVNESSPLGTTSWFGGNSAVFTAHTGSQYAAANFNSTGTVGNISSWLMAPTRTFNNGDTISFWSRTVDNRLFPDRLRLRLSLNGGSSVTANFSTVLLTINNGLTTNGYPNTWTQFSATITGLGGATSGRFAFHYDVPNGGANGANSDYIGLDDVAYTAVPEPATIAALGLGAMALIRRKRKSA